MDATWTYLMQGDCLERMREIPDGYVDAVIADLPYGITGSPWDCALSLDCLWLEYRRLCKGPLVLFAKQPFSSALVMSNPKRFKHEWVWQKNKVSGHLNAKRGPMSAHEVVLVFCEKTMVYNPQFTQGHRPGNRATSRTTTKVYGEHKPTEYGGSTQRYPRSVIDFSIVNNDDPTKVHPNQKPTMFLEYLTLTYTNPGQVVLDNTMGSGTAGVACVNTDRNFIGIEKDPDYFAVASRRVEEAKVARAAKREEPTQCQIP